MNRALAVTFVFVVALPLVAQEQSTRIWISFVDKSPDHSASQAMLAERSGITTRALHRRAKVLPADRLLDIHDHPVNPDYVRRIREAGMTIEATSKWLNAVAVNATPAQATTVMAMPFVAWTQPVARLSRPPDDFQPVSRTSPLLKNSQSGLNYGSSYTQLSNIKVTNLHDLGIDGTGVIVGMIDDGFNNHRAHPALKNIRILDEYDFIHDIATTQRQPWEPAGQGHHGAATLSALAGFHDGTLIGAAYNATLILAKTEMDSTEVPAEEHLYVEALEWMESLGADIISTSLGYVDWYPYDSLNGQTAITTRAARIAASKGVLLVTAMGNEGWFQKDSNGKTVPGLTGTMIAPADADSILAVGAVHSDFWLAAFSSTGPTADGRIKPDIMAQGVGVLAANTNTSPGSYYFANGTSLSTPLVAGAAALILSSQPDLTPMQLREAILQTAVEFQDPEDPSRTATYPNNYYGRGILDAYRALLYHGIALSSRPRVLLRDSLEVYFSATASPGILPDSIGLMVQVSGGGPFQWFPAIPTTVPSLYMASIPRSMDPAWPRGYVSSRDSLGRLRTAPFNAPESLYVFPNFVVPGIPGVTSIPIDFVIYANYPNPFNAGTVISFDAPGSRQIDLDVFDMLGRKVRTVFRGTSLAGRNIHEWDGRDDAGRAVSTGVYFFRLRSETTVLTHKLLLLR